MLDMLLRLEETYMILKENLKTAVNSFSKISKCIQKKKFQILGSVKNIPSFYGYGMV